MTPNYLNTIAARYLGADNLLLRSIQGIYNAYLDFRFSNSGLPTTINGVRFKLLPKYRYYRDYDAQVAAFLREHIKPGDVCFNVGANAGVYVLQLANWSSPDGRVVAFEPNPETMKILKKHISLNRFSDRVRVVEAAVSRVTGTAEFFASETDGMSSLGRANPMMPARANSLTVNVVCLDEYCAQADVFPDCLVMDIEGFEIAALQGAREIINSCRNRITLVVELHPPAWAHANTTEADFMEVLKDLRLRLNPLTGQKDCLKEFGIVHLEPY